MRFNTMKGAAVGATVVYLLDPVRGRARRALVSERVISLSRAAIASRQKRRSVVGNRRQLGQPVIPARRGRLSWRRAPAASPPDWEHPMATIQIDIDDRYAMPGLGFEATKRPIRPAHRGFTRVPAGTYWSLRGTGVVPSQDR